MLYFIIIMSIGVGKLVNMLLPVLNGTFRFTENALPKEENMIALQNMVA